MFKYYFLCLIFCFVGCLNQQQKEAKTNKQLTLNTTNNWAYNFDFDIDGRIDSIYYQYSGGAHCCYSLSVYLSSKKTKFDIPFEMEGGYLFFDLSRPDNFSIYDIDKDNRPEIFINSVDSMAIYQPIYVDFEKGKKSKYFNKMEYKTLPKNEK